MTALADTQRLLWRLITAPEGVAAALAADDATGGAERTALDRTVQSTGALDAVARLDIYANMYFFRLLDILRDDYPATAAAAGETGFHNLITDYLLRCPPCHYSVRHAGDRLPGFIAAHPIAARLPYLPDLARFERALNDAFDAADAAALDRATLAAVAPEDWPGLRFRLHPAVGLLRAAWAVHACREQVDAGAIPTPPDSGPTLLCVWREHLQVRYRVCAEPEWQALTALDRGSDFAGVCAAAAAAGDADGTLPARLTRALFDWLDAGVITAADPVD
jgi:hypothetical protein